MLHSPAHRTTEPFIIGIVTVGGSAAHTAEPHDDVTALYRCDVMRHDVDDTKTIRPSVGRYRLILSFMAAVREKSSHDKLRYALTSVSI